MATEGSEFELPVGSNVIQAGCGVLIEHFPLGVERQAHEAEHWLPASGEGKITYRYMHYPCGFMAQRVMSQARDNCRVSWPVTETGNVQHRGTGSVCATRYERRGVLLS